MRFPLTVVNPNDVSRSLGIKSSGWVEVRDADGSCVASFYGGTEEANLANAHAVVEATNAAIAKAEGSSHG